jgi:hypothetical protein
MSHAQDFLLDDGAGPARDDAFERSLEDREAEARAILDAAPKAAAAGLCLCGCGRKPKSKRAKFYRSKGRGNCKDRYHNARTGRLDRVIGHLSDRYYGDHDGF